MCKLLRIPLLTVVPNVYSPSRDQNSRTRACQRPFGCGCFVPRRFRRLDPCARNVPLPARAARLGPRLNGRVDTHVTSIQVVDGELCATRWFYRQRIEGVFSAICARGSCCSIPDVTRRIAALGKSNH